MTDPLAALLHDEWCIHFDPAEFSIPPEPTCEQRAARLIAAGVTLAPAEGLLHEMRAYARHAPLCNYSPTYPDAQAATCDCGFDAVLARYDPISAERKAPAPAEGLPCGHDVIGIRLAGYQEGRAEALGDVREFVDESHDRATAIAREYAALTPEDDR